MYIRIFSPELSSDIASAKGSSCHGLLNGEIKVFYAAHYEKSFL